MLLYICLESLSARLCYVNVIGVDVIDMFLFVAMRCYVLAVGVIAADGCRAKDTGKNQLGYVL